jgi:hypothetical protein
MTTASKPGKARYGAPLPTSDCALAARALHERSGEAQEAGDQSLTVPCIDVAGLDGRGCLVVDRAIPLDLPRIDSCPKATLEAPKLPGTATAAAFIAGRMRDRRSAGAQPHHHLGANSIVGSGASGRAEQSCAGRSRTAADRRTRKCCAPYRESVVPRQRQDPARSWRRWRRLWTWLGTGPPAASPPGPCFGSSADISSGRSSGFDHSSRGCHNDREQKLLVAPMAALMLLVHLERAAPVDGDFCLEASPISRSTTPGLGSRRHPIADRIAAGSNHLVIASSSAHLLHFRAPVRPPRSDRTFTRGRLAPPV